MAAGGRQRFASLSGAASSDPLANEFLPWGVWMSGYGQNGQLGGDYRLSPALTIASTSTTTATSPKTAQATP